MTRTRDGMSDLWRAVPFGAALGAVSGLAELARFLLI